MALLFMSGLDAVATTSDLARIPGHPDEVSGNLTINTSGGLNGGGCIECTANTNLGMTWNNYAQHTGRQIRLTCWYYWSGNTFSSTSPFFSMMRGSDGLTVSIQGDGKFRGHELDGGSSEGSTPASSVGLTPGAWNHIEIYGRISGSGDVIIRLNGEEVLNASRDFVDLATSSNEFFRVAARAGDKFDDIFLTDSHGTTFNDFLGPQVIYTCFPDGAGDRTELTPLAGNNWENVDDASPDDGTTYNSSSTSGQGDLYTVDTSGVDLKDITAIRVVNTASTPSELPQNFAPLVKAGTTEFTKQQTTVGSSYLSRTALYPTNEDTAAPWDPSDLSGLQIGMELE